MTIRNYRFFGAKKRCFFQSAAETTVTIGPCVPVILGVRVTYTDQVKKKQKSGGAASGEGEPRDKVIADTPVRFKSHVWKHLGFLRVKNSEKRKEDGQT